MERGSPQNTLNKKPSLAVYVLGFILGLHLALPLYVASSFLSQFIPEKIVGVIFALSSALSIVAFIFLPRLMRRFGNIKVTAATTLLGAGGLAIMAFLDAPILVIGAFGITYAAANVAVFVYDIFIEHFSSDTVTGEIRGTYLVFLNAAIAVSQPIAGLLITNDDFSVVFLAASAAALLLLTLTLFLFKRFKDPQYQNISIFSIFKTARNHKEIIDVYLLNFLLRFFYSWMVIYMPIYLHNHLGFEWKAITIMFGIMLLPFILDERPLGEIADRWLGEKELLIAGFLIMAISTGAMSFITTANFILWTAILFVSRIGASAVEVMTESYFFKHVDDGDASLIGFFRTTRPWAYIIGPISATILVSFIGVQYLFLVLGIVMAYGAFRTFSLKDTL